MFCNWYHEYCTVCEQNYQLINGGFNNLMTTQNNQVSKGNSFGIVSFVFGVIGIFILSIILCPLSIILGIVGVIKKQYVWSGIGIVCAIIGLLTSPIFFAIIGVSSATVGAR